MLHHVVATVVTPGDFQIYQARVLRAFSAEPDSLGGKKTDSRSIYGLAGCRLGQARFGGGWPLHKISRRSLGTVGFRESEYILLAASNRLRLRKGTISKGTVCLPTSLFRAHVTC